MLNMVLAKWELANMMALGVLNAMVPLLWWYLKYWWNEIEFSSTRITFYRVYTSVDWTILRLTYLSPRAKFKECRAMPQLIIAVALDKVSAWQCLNEGRRIYVGLLHKKHLVKGLNICMLIRYLGWVMRVEGEIIIKSPSSSEFPYHTLECCSIPSSCQCYLHNTMDCVGEHSLALHRCPLPVSPGVGTPGQTW